MQDIILNDERNGNFRYMWEYSSDVNVKMKNPIKSNRWYQFLNLIFNALMISITIAIMVFYQNTTTEDPTKGSFEKFPEKDIETS